MIKDYWDHLEKTNYPPLIVFGNTPNEQLIKLAVKKAIDFIKPSYHYVNEVNIWTCDMFTAQLEYKLRNLFTRAYAMENKNITEAQVNEYVRLIIKKYHLQVVEVYPELKEY